MKIKIFVFFTFLSLGLTSASFSLIQAFLGGLSVETLEIECNYEEVQNPFAGLNSTFFACNVETEIGFRQVKVADANDPNGTFTKSDVNLFIIEVEAAIFPQGVADVFPKIEGIRVSGTQLLILTSDDFKDFQELKYLSVTESFIQIVPAEIFAQNSKLTYIDLSENMIMFIDETAFDGLDNLEVPRVGGVSSCLFEGEAEDSNEVSVLLTQIRQNCTDLSSMYYAYNKAITDYVATIRIVENNEKMIEAIQDRIHELEETNGSCGDWEDELIKANKTIENAQSTIEDLESEVDACEDAKKELQLRIDDLEDELNPISGTCRFREEQNGEYSCLARNLEVERSDDQEVEWEGSHLSGHSAEDVTVVIIRSQTTLLLPTNIGEAFKNVKSLTVESSELGRLSNGDFDTLGGLTTLTINDNEISFIQSGVFDPLTDLVELDLSGNSISSLPLKAFAKLSSLEVLNLSDNQIAKLSLDLLPTTNDIREFSASNNQLTDLDTYFLHKLRKAELIDFSGNDGCDLKYEEEFDDFQEFFRQAMSEC